MVNKINVFFYFGEGLLFEFLCVNVDDWELFLGKVVCFELLECIDLVFVMVKDV